MSTFILSDSERKRFSQWLHSQAASDLGLAEQMESLKGRQFNLVAEYNRKRAAAYVLVATDLDNTESVSVGRQDTPT